MAYSESFEANLSEFLDEQFQGPLEIDTQALDTHEEMNALERNGVRLECS